MTDKHIKAVNAAQPKFTAGGKRCSDLKMVRAQIAMRQSLTTHRDGGRNSL